MGGVSGEKWLVGLGSMLMRRVGEVRCGVCDRVGSEVKGVSMEEAWVCYARLRGQPT